MKGNHSLDYQNKSKCICKSCYMWISVVDNCLKMFPILAVVVSGILVNTNEIRVKRPSKLLE